LSTVASAQSSVISHQSSNIDWASVRAETTRLLSQLIQFDTTNPPGHESSLAEFLADTLAEDGISARLLAATPGRANLVARLTGSGTLPPLLLLGHTDVVYADAAQWRVPPFGGLVREGCVWGRGALDMKGLLAMQVMALRLLKRSGLPLKRDVILLASADEEDTGRYGTGWVVDQHWDLVAADLVFGEGGVGVDLNGQTVFLIATAEKGYADLTLTSSGHASHASTPSSDNALIHLSDAIQRIAKYTSNVQWTEPVAQHVAALAPTRPFGERLLWAALGIPALAPWLADRVVGPTLRQAWRNTFTPTLAHAGRQPNVVPDLAEANVNCRILPGVTEAGLVREMQRIIGSLPIEVTVRQFNLASASPIDTPFFAALSRAALAETPRAIVAPYLMPGATDARHFRARGVTAYGLMPVVLSLEEMAAIHGVDEHIAVAHLERGTRVVFRVLCDVAGAG
jgi:acetylornithine deacetylase/succinyl-diaminopimelate desuccinylase-like protein